LIGVAATTGFAVTGVAGTAGDGLMIGVAGTTAGLTAAGAGAAAGPGTGMERGTIGTAGIGRGAGTGATATAAGAAGAVAGLGAAVAGVAAGTGAEAGGLGAAGIAGLAVVTGRLVAGIGGAALGGMLTKGASSQPSSKLSSGLGSFSVMTDSSVFDRCASAKHRAQARPLSRPPRHFSPKSCNGCGRFQNPGLV